MILDAEIKMPGCEPWRDTLLNSVECCQCHCKANELDAGQQGWRTFFTRSPIEQEHPEIFCAKCAADFLPWGCY